MGTPKKAPYPFKHICHPLIIHDARSHRRIFALNDARNTGRLFPLTLIVQVSYLRLSNGPQFLSFRTSTHPVRPNMRSLASETLAHIFSMGALIDPRRPLSYRDASTFAVLVSHVSHLWREISLSTPRLWRTVFFCGPFPLMSRSFIPGIPPNTLPKACRIELERIQTYLRRSWSVTLFIYLDLRDPTWSFDPSELSHPFHPSYMTHLLDLLIPHLSRWEDVEILSDTWKPLYHFIERCQTTSLRGMPIECPVEASNLRRLSLCRCNAYVALEGRRFLPLVLEDPISLFNKSSPVLRDISLSGVHLPWACEIFQNLTALSLNYQAQEVSPSLHEFVEILEASPKLEYLSIIGWGIRSFDDNSPQTFEHSIKLPLLRHLAIGWVNVQHTLKLCTLFSWRMPELHTIELEDISNSLELNLSQDSSLIFDYISTHLLGTEASLIGVPPRGIRNLRISYLSVTEQSFRRFMNALESLALLIVHNVEDHLVLLLTSFQEGGYEYILPNLRCITIGTYVSRPVLEQLALARRAYITEVNSGRSIRGISEAMSRSENQKMIIEVESLYDSESEVDERLDVGNREERSVSSSSPVF